ncbi:MAG: hypothetical protein IPL93_09065 [Actinomycetales bacterium]|nr:hypothetical protein [Actinomycetales bacterium]HMT32577.1 hypothetical protein [Dermatophilaceae bacterium]
MTDPATQPSLPTSGRPRRERRAVLVRLDPAVHEALVRWADDELRSLNAQLEIIVRQALLQEGRMPGHSGPLPRRGRPPKAAAGESSSH